MLPTSRHKNPLEYTHAARQTTAWDVSFFLPSQKARTPDGQTQTPWYHSQG